MKLSRRRFLTLLGVTPALPLIDRIPSPALPADKPIHSIPLSSMSAITASGWCAPVAPLYDFRDVSVVNNPLTDHTPIVRIR